MFFVDHLSVFLFVQLSCILTRAFEQTEFTCQSLALEQFYVGFIAIGYMIRLICTERYCIFDNIAVTFRGQEMNNKSARQCEKISGYARVS